MAAEPAVQPVLVVADVVRATAHALEQSGVPDSEQMAREIVAALLDEGRHWTKTHAESAAELQLRDRALGAAQRLALGMPFQYAVQRASFRRLSLHVDERVLIPRPETELLVELVLEMVGDTRGGVAVDVGTGSGAIALALADEGPFARVIGTDISRDALAVAQRNADALQLRLATPVELKSGAGLAPVKGIQARAIVSNPPYIAFDEAAALPPEVRDWEPATALFSGEQGLFATRALVREAADVLEPGGVLALEVDTRRASLVAELAAADAGFVEVAVRMDLTGRERFVFARRRE